MPFARCFIDDIVVASTSIEEHKLHLKAVINKLTKVNLKLNPDKCKFFQNKINLLGFRISPKDVSLDVHKVANVQDFPVPKTGKGIMRYCGFINYFQPLIPKASTLLAPLDALRNEKSLEKSWNTYPDLNRPFCVATDTSKVGVGVVLYQVIDEK
ncbi:hypothetical protein G6F57_017130 [Rhizopus arrhizus]|uniref:Reverse transcriptase domain-containing protein n=1 Tax=Rhizopus oryzae TaxID=64495 RepID=A0A9P7BK43_RHIOR|nr:hypothetical protein G6F24_013913 [Rhizopus arrhizus]KAG0777727.1 hypothetical protein G6F21_013253 [Rhizopus arrhizus]KAG0803764.1 hypothetical protein G6F20_013236 [Rhizopus arrhizus]KAG0812061.1 hypothetical protein G6F19_013367 [Rhizopus arrhizus]KAG0813179.1 hypothetical protein G6F18_013338 [Rhizopus arrhizus]